MKTFQQYLQENRTGNWQFPSGQNLEQEYKVEYQLHFKHSFGDIFPTFDSWKAAIRAGTRTVIDPTVDRKIGNRSHCGTLDSLLNLIKSYRSYPQFRNEQTLMNLKDRLDRGLPLDMPLVYEDKLKRLFVVAGNTRMDMAFILGINPTVIIFREVDQ